MKKNRALGGRGEQMAVNFLCDREYIILERNYRYKKSEIDIIAQRDGLMIFVEVKTRSSTAFGYPEEAVSIQQKKKILEGAEQYTHDYQWAGAIRFDIIAIYLGDPPELKHFQDAFY